MSKPAPTPQELISILRGAGVKVSEIAAECDRDSSLIYQVAAGKRPGANLLPTLMDLATKGYATKRPERRTTKTGKPARVRAGKGKAAREPKPPKPTAPTPGKFSVHRRILGAGGRTYRITAPKSGRVGRFDAKRATMSAMARAAKERKHIAFVIHYADGSSRGLGAKGGYAGDAAFSRAHAEWQDPFAWLKNEVEGVASYEPGIDEPITGVDITIFGPSLEEQDIPEEVDEWLIPDHLLDDPTKWSEDFDDLNDDGFDDDEGLDDDT